ncbi:MAG: DUF547 domain-containing protein [Myxococcales bacterium]|nr:DUF547 domain-containing protein [Myxococcales bacterium]MCB9629951.1 DUF547 domain-containing protein [Sandaracinaceae bacterium]
MLSPKTSSTFGATPLFALATLGLLAALGAGCGGSAAPPAPVAEPHDPSDEPGGAPASQAPADPAPGAPAGGPMPEPPPQAAERLSEGWTALLGRYRTADGGFRYAALQTAEADRAMLTRLVLAVGDARPADLQGRDAQLAFYLNAYNVLTVNAVVTRLPIDSVMSVPGFFDTIEHDVMGTPMTLNALENDIIRAQYHEPRIHFAVNCASAGCPWLDATAFTPGALEGALDRLTRAFVARTTSLDSRRRRVVVSQLFEWFAGDFEPSGGVRAFLVAHTDDPSTRSAVADERNRIAYFEYDWALNARP